ncbi:cyclophilin-like fold protein [Shewanella putrefaciens]|nr:hypothetical protein SHEWT2_00781 [Shewanella hafniensis]
MDIDSKWLSFLATLMSAIGATFASVSVSASSHNEFISMQNGIKIRIIIASTVLTATLENTDVGRDFVKLLPLELTLADYNGTEKIADLPARLSNKEAPEGYPPKVGDIAYFAPWGNLAFFYHDFTYSRGLVRLGHIDGSIEYLIGDSDINVRIERSVEAD